MPSLSGAGIRVGLATHELDATLTEKVELRKGNKAAEKCGSVEKLLYGSVINLLPEERVPFPGEEGDYGLHWMGDVPFFQVSVGGRRSEKVRRMGSGRRTAGKGANVFNKETLEESEKNGDTELRALILHIILSEKSFQFPLGNTTQHLKIEVLFNGQLANCVLVQLNEIRTGAKKLHQVFSGTRIDYLTERPWIFTPDKPTEAASNTVGAEARWTEISDALMKEAIERGIDGNGERPPTATYICELASMEMPESVRQMQRQGGVKFGIIDVIVSIGHGKKTVQGVTYLKAPTRLDDPKLGDEAKKHGSSEKTAPPEPKSGTNRKESATLGRQELTKDDTAVEGATTHDVAVKEYIKRSRKGGASLGGSVFFSSACYEVPCFLNTPTSPQSSSPLPRLELDPALQLNGSNLLLPSPSHAVDQYEHLQHANSQPVMGMLEGRQTRSPDLQCVTEFNDGLLMSTQTFLPDQVAPNSESHHSVDSHEDTTLKHPYFKVPFSIPRGTLATISSSAEQKFEGMQEYERQLELAKERRFSGPSLPYLRYSSTSSTAPWPPIGLYTVPEKPKTELSTILKFKATRTSIKVTHFVIRGMDGKTIVDQRWTEPQYITSQTMTSPKLFSQSRLTVEVEKDEDAERLVVKIRGLPRVGVLPSSIMSPGLPWPDSITSGLASPVLPVNAGRVNAASISRRHTIDDAIGLKTPRCATSPSLPVVSPSSSIEKQSVPNEGSAHPSWLDPLLKDMTPLPQNCNKVLSGTPQSSASVVETTEQTRYESSSRPLASQTVAAVPATVSGRPQRSAVTRKRKLIPDSNSDSEFAPESPVSTPKAKRQRAHVYVKPPRSPDRLDASSNASINEDCAIRLATSEKMGGALRQIKAQRAGTFTEEGVLVGVRYFVVG